MHVKSFPTLCRITGDFTNHVVTVLGCLCSSDECASNIPVAHKFQTDVCRGDSLRYAVGDSALVLAEVYFDSETAYIVLYKGELGWLFEEEVDLLDSC